MRLLKIIIALGTFALPILTGCKVGPDFHSPQAPQVNSFTESPQATKTVSAKHLKNAGKSQYFVNGKDIPAQWWTLFHSPELNDLIQAGMAHSPNLEAAKATLVQAQELLKAQIGNSLFPQVGLGFSGNRQRFSDATIGAPGQGSQVFNLYNVNVPVTYTLDLFGGARRQVESVSAQLDQAQYQLQAAYLTLAANIVTTAITMASFDAQIKATQELIKIQTENLAIVRRQLKYGAVSRSDVLLQESQLATTRATLPPLMQSLAQAKHALSVLIGEFPSDDKIPHFSLEKLTLPRELPVSLPSNLVRQRPDIQAQEAALHYASAQIGVATANLYPQITLSGNFGYTNDTLANMIEAHLAAWSYGVNILQPIFYGGALRAKKRAAVEAYKIALAQYRQTVLQAFQNVADTLYALENDAKTLREQKDAEEAARNSLLITQKQYKVGGVSYLNLLTAQKQYQQARINLIQAEATRYNDTAGLFQALGGGWWNRT